MEKRINKSILLFAYVVVFLICVKVIRIRGEGILWTQCLAYILLGLLAVYIFRDEIKTGVKLWKMNPIKNVLWLIGSFIADMGLNILSNYLQYVLYPDYISMQENSIERAFSSSVPDIVLILALGIFGPILEEAIYRLFLVGNLSKKISSFIVIPVAALLFMTMHMNALTLPELISHLPKFFTGLVYGITYKVTKNSTISIGLHVFNNFPTLILIAISVAWK